ncbi:MAG: hypothetical protein FWE36_05070 [Erysipelotrichales bacterium]|nr:hypothetical protein [Erysipelotrichales bacterium]
MKKIKRKLNIFSFLIIAILVLALFIWQDLSLQAHYSIQRDERVISSATIDDDL